MITSQELADGIRFAGARCVAALDHVHEWDYQLGHEWTTAQAFQHVAATAGGLAGFYPLLDGDVLNAMGVPEVAAMNAQTLDQFKETGRDELRQMILDGAEASARFAESLDDDDLAVEVELGGYQMPKAEIVAQIWIHHQIAHSYEASARWPLL